MKLTAIITLIVGAVLLMVYPAWGLLHPESYVAVLVAEHANAAGATPGQVQRSAAMVWAPNGILASCFVCLAGFVANPTRSLHGRWAGGCLIVYPFVRTAVEAWSGYNITSHAAEPEFTFFFDAEKLVYIAFGLALLGITASLASQADHTEH